MGDGDGVSLGLLGDGVAVGAMVGVGAAMFEAGDDTGIATVAGVSSAGAEVGSAWEPQAESAESVNAAIAGTDMRKRGVVSAIGY